MASWLVGWLAGEFCSQPVLFPFSQKLKVAALLQEVKARRGTAATGPRQRGYHSSAARSHRAELHRERWQERSSGVAGSRDDRQDERRREERRDERRDDRSDRRQHGAGKW